MRIWNRTALGLGAGTASVLALTLGLATPAHADYGPSLSDVVGVGSDTVQYMGDFMADGDPGGDSGWNSNSPKNRLVSFDATPDANARAGYLNGSTSSALKALNPTIVLRAGTSPIQRPNGSGGGMNALMADTTAPYQINFVRSSRPPTACEEQKAGNEGFGGLHVVQISTDPLEIATASTTNAPSGGLSAQQLVKIYDGDYQKWGDIPGYSGSAPGDTIVPQIPQTGSGTRNTFIADLTANGNGGHAFNLTNPNLQTVEENDPNSITGPDVIDPFSAGRLALYKTGYFHDPTTPFPAYRAFFSGSERMS